MVPESGKERLEELGEEVPSLILKKGSAFLQRSRCPGKLLPGIRAAAGSAPGCAPCLGLRVVRGWQAAARA